MSFSNKLCVCPVCYKEYSDKEIEGHVSKCIFLNSESESTSPNRKFRSPGTKCKEASNSQAMTINLENHSIQNGSNTDASLIYDGSTPLAERMRPEDLSNFFGQEHILGHAKSLRTLLEKNDVPNMILWGPPGCGKTSLAHVIANQCKINNNQCRFEKLSATMDGINKIKEVAKIAKNEAAFKRKTILFVDEIHRFNKIQQDVFLPLVESGVVTVIGATTENPSFRLRNALLSRCCVYEMKKLHTEDILQITKQALASINIAIVKPGQKEFQINSLPWAAIDEASVIWMAEVCDGDARIALNNVQLAQSILRQRKEADPTISVVSLSLDEVKDCVKRSQILYDKKGDEHYNIISALHKSIRASDENASLYWLNRMLEGGEDPMFIARRLVRAASEDIGLAEPSAISLAVSTMQGCEQLGMPDCAVLLAQCAVHLAKAPKSTEVYKALGRAMALVTEQKKKALPPIPFHLLPTLILEDLGYEEDLEYMPEGMERVNFF